VTTPWLDATSEDPAKGSRDEGVPVRRVGGTVGTPEDDVLLSRLFGLRGIGRIAVHRHSP
jgi:hypothetical protein